MAQVLIVDDDPSIRQLITDVLEIDGHQVRVAVDGNAAVSALALLRPDCVVLDVMMPGIDGYGVLRCIRNQYGGQVSVIMLTAAAEPASAQRAWEDGVDYYLAKPFDVEELIGLIDRME